MHDAALHIAHKMGQGHGRSGAASEDASRDAASDADRLEPVAVSTQEISELVCGALEDAVSAVTQPCPRTFLNVLEGRKRNDVVLQMNDLPPIQMIHPVVQAEVLKELARIRAQRKLANGIVDAIRDYARSKRRSAIASMT